MPYTELTSVARTGTSSPWASLSVLIAVFCIELIVRFVLPKWELFPRGTPEQRKEAKELEEKIRSLRIKSNQYNSPDSFVSYALIQRELGPLTQRQEQLKAALEPTTTDRLYRRVFYAVAKLVMYAVLALWWWKTPFFTFAAVSAVAPWSFPDAVGVVPWIGISSRVAAMAVTFFDKSVQSSRSKRHAD